MAGLIYPDASKGGDYHGLSSIFEFVNDDGQLWRTNCGLAAAATYLTYCQASPAKTGLDLLSFLEEQFPPDILGGLFGASRRRVRQIARAFGCHLHAIAGEAELRAALTVGRPVIVMLSTPQGKFLGFDLPGGHWMVAYGYDDEYVYLTNSDKMTWDEFRRGWNGWIPALIGMRKRGLVAQ
jgi:hypothetical protein